MLRFPLSPAEVLHIDRMRLALIHYIVSRQREEPYSVYIEDLHRDEATGEKEQESLALLKKFAIEQEQLFYQSEYLGRYQQFALSLLAQHKAFACICDSTSHCSGTCLQTQTQTARRIQSEKLPFSVRLHKPTVAITFHDILKGEITTEADTIGELLLLDTHGIPTETFAAACDEMLGNVTLVIRDETEIDHTAEQIHIREMLGYTAESSYAHLPPLLGTVSVKSLLEEGFLPDAIINYLLSIGTTPPLAYFTLPDALQWFDLSKLSHSTDTFDIQKLRALNSVHLQHMEEKALSRLFGFADADIGRLLKLYLPEAATINALEKIIQTLFAPKELREPWAEEIRQIAKLIQEAPMLDQFDDFQVYLEAHSELEGEKLLTPLRLLMTGTTEGPELDEIYPLIKPYITEIARYTP